MHRRSILSRPWAAPLPAHAPAPPARHLTPSVRLKVDHRLSDLEKVNFVLGNIQNHFDGVGGPANAPIALVIHGPALCAFHSASANPDRSRRVREFSGDGVELAACGNTMKSPNVSLKGLLPRLRGRRQGPRPPPRRAAAAGLPLSRALNGAPHRHKIVQSSRLHRIKSEGSNLTGWSCLLLMRIFPLGSPFRPVLTIRSRPRKLLGNPITDPIEQKQAS